MKEKLKTFSSIKNCTFSDDKIYNIQNNEKNLILLQNKK